ncbi:hypothetical protein SPF06_15375 [Sinomonas sp. JGH33]|uniref:Uncharacterized protein n=1 Tax=Sinomonas terricola TaxID=3110330 RepID=A0ABU5T8Z4_9MICC|nr:hypothetical protein [Sinomonas sp. JGH33]
MCAISHHERNRSGVSDWSGKGAVIVLGAVVGIFGSTFGPFKSMLAGLIVTAVGLAFRGKTWASVVLAVGIAVIVGACAYILLGIMMSHGSGRGSGGYCEPGLTCEPQ